MQGVNGFHFGGFVGRVQAEHQPDDKAEAHRNEYHSQIQPEHHAQTGHHRVHDLQNGPAEENTQTAAHHALHHRLHEKLLQNGAPAGADGLADADLPGALGDGDQHDVHDADAAHQQGDGGDAAQHQGLHHALALQTFGAAVVALYPVVAHVRPALLVFGEHAGQEGVQPGHGLHGGLGALGLDHVAVDGAVAVEGAVEGVGQDDDVVHLGPVLDVHGLVPTHHQEGDAVDQ